MWYYSWAVTEKMRNINKAVLEPRVSPAFAITYFCNHCNIRFGNTSKYVDTQTLFSKNLNQRSLTPRWPLTPCLLRSHVWLYPRIIVSKSHDNTSMYVDTVINFAKYHIHTHTYYVHTTHILHTYYVHITYRMSDHIVSYWTQFRRDKKTTGRMHRQNQETCCIADILGPQRCGMEVGTGLGNQSVWVGTATHRIATTYHGT